MQILATKDGQFKKFSDVAWKLLGKTKNGWTEVSQHESPVANNSKGGPGNQIVTNEIDAENKAAEVEVKNELETTTSNEVVNEEAKEEVVFDAENKAAFLEIVKENIKRNQIKDYLDENKISYKQNITNPDIAELLFTTLKGDIEVLKTTFKLS